MSNCFCPLPWVGYSMKANGYIRVCCHANQGPRSGLILKDDGSCYTYKDDINDLRNAKILKEIRMSILNHKWHPECVRCMNEYDSGLHNRNKEETRIWKNNFTLADAIKHTNEDGTIDVDNVPMLYYDLRFGNKCNLKCRICGPTDSSGWYSDLKYVYRSSTYYDAGEEIEIIEENGKYVAKNDPYGWYNDERFWEVIKKHIHTIRKIYIIGGEPLLINQHFDFLNDCVESGASKRITLEYNTNLTILPDKAMELWKEFEGVYLGVSVDGFGEVNEYIRYPSKWDVVERNIKKVYKMSPNCKVKIHPTISVYNILNIFRLIKWSLEEIDRDAFILAFHPLHTPVFLNIKAFPHNRKVIIKEFLLDQKEQFKHLGYNDDINKEVEEFTEAYINHMFQDDYSDQASVFWEINDRIDTLRNQKIEDFIPELVEYLPRTSVENSTIEKVESSVDGLVLDVELSNMCNYSCSYCHPNTYRGNTSIDYDKLIKFIDITDPYFIILGGGEPSIYPKIDELLMYLKDRVVMLVTNGSLPLEWWAQNIEFIDYPAISYHLEHADFNKFRALTKYIADRKHVKINVSMIQNRFDECLQVVNALKDIDNTTIVMKVLKDKKKQKTFEYTEEQFELMRNNNHESEEMNDIICTYNNGNKIQRSASDLIINEENIYSGWLCYKGIDLLKINPLGNVFGASCDLITNNFICNIDTPEDITNIKPVICKKKHCFCTPDLRVIRKEKI